MGSEVHTVFALPVTVAFSPVGALDVFDRRTGPLSDTAPTDGLVAARPPPWRCWT